MEDIRQFLLKKEAERWIKDNPKLMEDVVEIFDLAVVFKFKWGIPLKIVLDENYKEPQGRGLGLKTEQTKQDATII